MSQNFLQLFGRSPETFGGDIGEITNHCRARVNAAVENLSRRADAEDLGAATPRDPYAALADRVAESSSLSPAQSADTSMSSDAVSLDQARAAMLAQELATPTSETNIYDIAA